MQHNIKIIALDYINDHMTTRKLTQTEWTLTRQKYEKSNKRQNSKVKNLK